MSDAVIIALARDALMTALYVSLPMLAAALVVGLLVSILQVATSIQDATIATVPKILAVLAALLVSLQWIVRTMVSYATRVLEGIPGLLG